VNQPEYSEQVNEYYPSTHVNKGLLKTAFSPLYDHTAGSADMYRTDYEYDARGNVTKMLESAAHAGEDRPEWTYTYDSEDRRLTQVDPIGHTITYMYDDQGRVIRTTYDDGSTSEMLYGTAGSRQEHLVLKVKDRRDVVTDYQYDSSGRPVTVTQASATDVNILDGQAGNLIAKRNKKSITTYAYLHGTPLPISIVIDGSTTDIVRDYRHRVLETTTYRCENQSLVTKREFLNNESFSVADPYGRHTYFAHRASDGVLIRRIQGRFTSFSLPDEAAVLGTPRDYSQNADYVVKDILKNAVGQVELLIDGLGVQHKTYHDSNGRAVRQVAAFASPVVAITETDYDAAGRPVEVRSPGYFDPSDTNGFQNSKSVLTYDGRGNLESRSEAPGTPEGATEFYTYALDDRQATRTDFRGKLWTASYAGCCGQGARVRDPLGHGRITNADHLGNLTHTASIANVDSQIDWNDPLDSLTLEEVTTRFDELGRQTARTQWQFQRGTIDPNAVPIAGLDGAPIADGLTTQILYDSDLTDGIGLDSAVGMAAEKLGGGTYNVSLAAALTKLAEPTSSGGGDTTFAAGATGSASVKINAEEGLQFTIYDSLGGIVMDGTIAPHSDSAPSSLASWTCTIRRAHPHPTHGVLTELQTVSALGYVRASRFDGTLRLIEVSDVTGIIEVNSYDAAGNRVSHRDANGNGFDCVFDELKRQTSRTDTMGHTTQVSYAKDGVVTATTDNRTEDATYTFDARNRQTGRTDRTGSSTTWTYDAAGNLTTLTDGVGEVTEYTYDDAGQRTVLQFPDHVAGSALGDIGYGLVHYTYDAAGQLTLTEDQQGDTVAIAYDLSGRVVSRVYTGHASSPLGGLSDTDTLTYDRNGQLLSASKGRYGNIVGFTFDHQGRKATESLESHDQTYLTAYTYDTLGRVQSITMPDGSVTTRSYTDRGELASVGYSPAGGAVQSVATFAYDLGGRESSRNLGNGLTTTRTYFADNLVQSIVTPGLDSLTYGYDANKNLTSETRTGIMMPYSWSTGTSGFDAEDRLVSWTRANGDSQTWALSNVRDWNTFTINGAAQTRSHAPAHEIQTMSGSGVTGNLATLTYDSKGNLTQDERGADMAWDFENKLQSFTANGVTGLSDATYEYDALGRRIAKSVSHSSGIATTIFVHAGQQVVAEYRKDNAPSHPDRKYCYGAYIDEPLLLIDAETSQEQNLWLHADRQYNVTAMTDASGAVEEFYAYSPYGARTNVSPSGNVRTGPALHQCSKGYTSQQLDFESGLMYFRARMLSPSGQFLQRDPTGYGDGENLYSNYFGLRDLDPTGKTLTLLPPFRPFPIPIPDLYGPCSGTEFHAKRRIGEIYAWLGAAMGPVGGGATFPNFDSMPFQHCMWNCRMTRAGDEQYAEFWSLIKEMADISLCDYAKSIPKKCFDSMGYGTRRLLIMTCCSAMQPSDFVDNAIGRKCGLDYQPPTCGSGLYNPTTCKNCCNANGLNEYTNDGPYTSRPCGPYMNPSWNGPISNSFPFERRPKDITLHVDVF
jgi:RHS repeat-associated protein